jgi:putative effector of murein hydrolase
MLVALLLSTWIGLLVTALVLRALLRGAMRRGRGAMNRLRQPLGLPVGHAAVRADGHAGCLRAGVCRLRRLGHAALGQPGAVVGGAVLALLLHASGTPYPTYFSGAQFIHFLLGPGGGGAGLAAVAAACRTAPHVPGVLLLAALAGGAAASGSAVAIGWAVGLPGEVMASLAPKSVTAPVAMGIAEQLGGIPALAAVFAVLTGLVGAVTAKYLLDACACSQPAVRGFALGTASHGIGAARALQVHPDAGAYAGAGLGLQAVLAALLMPWHAAVLTSPATFSCKPTWPPSSKARATAQEAEAILRKCVHCGFCTATCPTYQLLGDELDGPRGRIYLMKQVLEGAPVTRKHAAAPGPLPDLPQLRDHLPQRRAVRPPGGHRPQDRRRARRTPRGEKAVRWLLKAGPDLAAVRPGDEAGAAGAPAAAGGAEGQGAGARRRAGRTSGPRARTSARC